MMELSRLREIVSDMHTVPMAMSLIHLTGDAAVLDLIEPYVHGPWDHQETVPESIKSQLRELTALALWRHFEKDAPLAEVSPALMRRMLDAAAGEEVPEEYQPLIMAQMGEDVDARKVSRPTSLVPRDVMHAVIIGAGVSGICAAINLKDRGISFDVIEKNKEVGGTWLENIYPGCAVDTPNHFYQFSFEPNNQWPHYYSRGEDNLEYLRMCVKKYDIYRHIKFQCVVDRAVYDEEKGEWTISYSDASGRKSEKKANILITAVGQLNRPAIPDIPGLADFGGSAFHTAEWPRDLEIAGKDVALIGAAASGIQVACAIADKVQSLAIFQRSPSWVVRSPSVHRTVPDNLKWALENVPFYAPWYRFQLFWAFADGLHPALQVDPKWKGDPRAVNQKSDRIRQAIESYARSELGERSDLLKSVLPNYPPYSKRALADPGWYRTLRRANVSLTSSPISKIEADGVRTEDGNFAHADILVMATGFQAGRMLWPMDIVGLDGKTIRDVWGDHDPSAYLGMAVPGFPNLFVMYGPNIATAHGGSYTFLAECQTTYIMSCIEGMLREDLKSLEVRREVHQQYNDELNTALDGLVWSLPDVRSWYKNSEGRVTTNFPWRLIDLWNRTRVASLAEYQAIKKSHSLNNAVDMAEGAAVHD